MPLEILELHNNIFLGINLMFVNDIPNFITALSKIKLVTVEDINVAEDIFGKDIFALKGKTTRRSPYAVTMDIIEMPPEILELHNDTFLGIDLMFVNGDRGKLQHLEHLWRLQV